VLNGQRLFLQLEIKLPPKIMEVLTIPYSLSTINGVADFGYDLYLLAIAKLLNSEYSRLLSFYFHTLIQQSPINY
jgi:hypothetical protein